MTEELFKDVLFRKLTERGEEKVERDKFDKEYEEMKEDFNIFLEITNEAVEQTRVVEDSIKRAGKRIEKQHTKKKRKK